MTRVLVTAFEPFGGETVNPSQQAVQTLSAGPAPAGVELVTAFLPVVFGAAIDALKAAVTAHDPDLVICTGEAGGRLAVTPERVAVNIDDAPYRTTPAAPPSTSRSSPAPLLPTCPRCRSPRSSPPCTKRASPPPRAPRPEPTSATTCSTGSCT